MKKNKKYIIFLTLILAIIGFIYCMLYSGFKIKDGIVMSSWNCFTVGYWALKRMGWMVDPENGDYTITSTAKEDLRYQQVYHLMLPYEKGIKKGDEKYITHESVDAHAGFSSTCLFR